MHDFYMYFIGGKEVTGDISILKKKAKEENMSIFFKIPFPISNR